MKVSPEGVLVFGRMAMKVSPEGGLVFGQMAMKVSPEEPSPAGWASGEIVHGWPGTSFQSDSGRFLPLSAHCDIPLISWHCRLMVSAPVCTKQTSTERSAPWPIICPLMQARGRSPGLSQKNATQLHTYIISCVAKRRIYLEKSTHNFHFIFIS